MEFIQCKNCNKIIAIKDLAIPFSESLLDGANSSNTVKGNDICSTCAEAIEEAQQEAETIDTDQQGEGQ